MNRKLIDLFTFAVNRLRAARATKSRGERHSLCVLRVGRFGRSLIYRPLAIALAILLVPSLSWFESTAGIDLGTGAQAFQASAQIGIASCNPSQPNAIIQTDCPGGVLYAPDLYTFESDSVKAYLALHNLAPTDAHLIYDDGRADLRSAVRGVMLSTLLGIIAKPAANRSTHEQSLYNWLQYLVQQNEIAEYTSAINQYHVWQNDPCDFTLDAAIAAQYKLSYDGAPFCGNTYNNLFGGPPVPAESYFLAYGLKNSYGYPAQTTPNFGALVAGTGLGLGEVEGIGLAAGAVVGTALAATIAASAAAALAAFDAVGVAVGVTSTASFAAGASALFIVSGATVDVVGIGLFAAGPLAIILLAVAIGVDAGMQAFSNQQTIDDLNNLSNTLTQATNTKPDLNAFATDPTGLGMLKLTETLTAQTLPDVPSTAALPAHQATDPSFSITPSEGVTVSTTVSTTLTYQDWNSVNWSAQTYGGWFVQTCNSGSNCTQADSIIGSINYVDWSGTQWIASRIGLNFASTKQSPASTDAPCPANETTGVSTVPVTGNFSACSSYVYSSIQLKDANGNPITVSLTFPPPSFTGPTALNFTANQNSSVLIAASGTPTPSISFSGNAPAGFTLSAGTVPGTASLSYSGAAPGPSSVTLVASNTVGSTTQTFPITVTTALQITSPPTLYATVGIPVNFLVTTTGTLPISLSWSFGTPNGLTFTDNGNGTATISGTPTSLLLIQCAVNGLACGITATNSQGSVTQSVTQPFVLNLNPSPSPNLVSSSATFVAGIPNSVRVASTGAITPVSYVFGQGYPAPSWLSFHDNGDGSGVLSGTPPDGTAGPYTFTLMPIAVGNGIISYGSGGNFTLNVSDAPVFITPNAATFTVGTAGSFDIDTNGASVSASGVTFPQGLTFQSGAPASIAGTPAPGTGGVQTVPLTATDSGGSASQMLTINIYEAPKIASANSATFFTGMPGSFSVTTTGYPSLSTQPLSQTPPTSPTQGQGMYFAVTGLPPDLQYSNLNPQGLATGTLTIQGTPSAADAGTHQVTITATNGVGVAAQQTLMLDIIRITGPAPASGKTCNGNYNGTFKGSITVSAGQNCGFVDGGGVTGNVAMSGGNLTIANGTITGNVQIQGAAAFSFGPGTTINGNLAIQNVASGVSMNQICGTKILGNLQVSGNATPFQLGSASPDSCPGNSIGGNLAINSNTAAAAVFNSDVAKNLSCVSNTSITGAGNTAESKQGQCSAF